MTVVPLLVVRLLFRSKAGFGSLPHVVNAVSVFLDTSVELPLERASKLGSLPLLNRIWDSLEMLPDHSSWSVRRLLLQEDSYTERQFRLSLTEACKKNDLSMVQWIFEHFPGRGVHMQVVEEAAAAGAMDIIQYFADNERDSEVDTRLAKRDIFFGGKDTANAAAGGHSDIVRWLYQFETDYERDDAATMEAAVANGDKDLVRWLHQVMEIQVCGVPRAAANGHLSMLQFLSAFDRIPAGVVVQAAKNGHLDVVRWAIDRDWDNEKDEEDSDEEDFYTSGFYSRQRKISRPPYLTSIGGEASLAVHTAAINGHLKVAKYLHARVDWPMDYEEQKVNSKRLRNTLAEIEKELGKDHQAAPISRKTMLEVVRKGLLEVVEWLCFEFSGNHTIDLFRPLNEEDTLFSERDRKYDAPDTTKS
ncbi:hypothetical protein PF010_g18369 [Phytophthora fragariae]|uniref:Uncharacterized protein n=1 Tax=Phytophthora fragariae TaxID=53985 RepID=A0A6G0KL87_9STRA|nr:hypothetical protein PF010_g18369 [Phytophthora fragariae]